MISLAIQTLARCCIDNIGALCDIYKFNVKDLVDLHAYHLKCRIWDVLAVRCDSIDRITFLYISVVSVVFTVFLLCFIVVYGFAASA